MNHYDKAGRFVEAIAVPGVTQVSSCAFGGGDGRSVLFITTSRQDLRDGEQPNAGAVFSIRTGVRGARPRRSFTLSRMVVLEHSGALSTDAASQLATWKAKFEP